MPVGNPHHKGTGLMPIVQALQMNPLARRLVPKDLWHYLEGGVLPSCWYPERHYAVLVEALASTIDSRAVGGNVWQYFGKVAAQRDLVGEQDEAPESVGRTGSSGLYRRFVKDGASASDFVLRATKIWQLYHDTGRIEAFRRAGSERVVVLRLTGFRFPVPGMEELHSAYLAEYARISGVDVTMTLVKSPSRGDSAYEWDTVLTGPDADDWVRTLPEI